MTAAKWAESSVYEALASRVQASGWTAARPVSGAPTDLRHPEPRSDDERRSSALAAEHLLFRRKPPLLLARRVSNPCCPAVSDGQNGLILPFPGCVAQGATTTQQWATVGVDGCCKCVILRVMQALKRATVSRTVSVNRLRKTASEACPSLDER